jgi:hypothetical protein
VGFVVDEVALRYVFSEYFGYRSWLKHYAPNRKVAGSSPDELDFSIDRTMALGSTQPLTEMSTRKIPGR